MVRNIFTSIRMTRLSAFFLLFLALGLGVVFANSSPEVHQLNKLSVYDSAGKKVGDVLQFTQDNVMNGGTPELQSVTPIIVFQVGDDVFPVRVGPRFFGSTSSPGYVGFTGVGCSGQAYILGSGNGSYLTNLPIFEVGYPENTIYASSKGPNDQGGTPAVEQFTVLSYSGSERNGGQCNDASYTFDGYGLPANAVGKLGDKFTPPFSVR